MPRFRNTNQLKVRNKVNKKLNDLLIFMALGDASFWPSTVMNILLSDSHEPLKGEHIV